MKYYVYSALGIALLNLVSMGMIGLLTLLLFQPLFNKFWPYAFETLGDQTWPLMIVAGFVLSGTVFGLFFIKKALASWEFSQPILWTIQILFVTAILFLFWLAAGTHLQKRLKAMPRSEFLKNALYVDIRRDDVARFEANSSALPADEFDKHFWAKYSVDQPAPKCLAYLTSLGADPSKYPPQ